MPDDFNISDGNREKANNLAKKFVSYTRNDGEDSRNIRAENLGREADGDVQLQDVVEDVITISRLVNYAKSNDREIAVTEIRGVGTVPILPSPAFGEELFDDRYWYWYRSGRYGRSFRDLQRSAPIKLLPVGEIFEGLTNGLALFLGYRLQGFDFWSKKRPQSSQAPTPPSRRRPIPGTATPGLTGFHIKLTCRHHDLASYASPAYAITWRNFGSMTTPAYGILPPGAWIFGAQGGLFPTIKDDPNPVHIPDNFTPCTNYF